MSSTIIKEQQHMQQHVHPQQRRKRQRLRRSFRCNGIPQCVILLTISFVLIIGRTQTTYATTTRTTILHPTNEPSSNTKQHTLLVATATATTTTPTGSIDDISNQCLVEDIEHINTVQLYEILHNLKHLSTIRNIQIDLSPICSFSPLITTTGTTHNNNKKITKGKETTSHTTTSSPLSNADETQTSNETVTTETKNKSSTTDNGSSSSSDDAYQCTGGNVSDEIDDDAEPLCTIQGSSTSSGISTTDGTSTSASSSAFSSKNKNPKFPFTASSSSTTTYKKSKKKASVPTSNVLHQLQQDGFTSQSQQDTFTWRDMTDTIFTELSDGSKSSTSNPTSTTDDEDCGCGIESDPHSSVSISTKEKKTGTKSSNTKLDSEEMLQPDHFWEDMCSALWNTDRTTSSATMINLALNPERNTGYNGTHIWRAIYDENCIVTTNQQQQQHDKQNEMCYEERVLYRLLSGLHTSTTISIAKNYFPPSKKKNRTVWESNPKYFIEHFHNHPEYIRNLHFTYAVLLRALSKASAFLYQYDFNTTTITSNIVDNNNDDIKLINEDIVMTQKLVRRLLDTTILQSCQPVFMAFDESLMFQEVQPTSNNNATSYNFPNLHTTENIDYSNIINSNNKVDVALLRQNFKGVFQNVSSILDCVQCQQCKLHGKLVMLGYGAALKVLLMQNITSDVLEHNEIIALINTVIKFSESIKDVRELTNLYVLQQQQINNTSTVMIVPSTIKEIENQPKILINKPAPVNPISKESYGNMNRPGVDGIIPSSSIITDNIELIDLAVNVIATLGRNKHITFDREKEMIELVLKRNVELLLLIKYYHTDIDKLLQLSKSIVRDNTLPSGNSRAVIVEDRTIPDAIVVGSGLAGMATTLNILDRGGRVILIEKEHVMGGNSGKASSGINACCLPNSTNKVDSQELFWNDTYRSAGASAQSELISTLVSKSANAVTWLQSRLGVDLSLVAQLGGHSTHRTHRPKNGMVGAEIIYAIQKAIKSYTKTKHVTILTDTKVTKLLTDENGAVIGVEYVSSLANDDKKNISKLPIQIYAGNVVLATGGFASDRSDGSYLSHYRPELLKMPATAGPFSTGDGIKLATQLGAATVDMDKVQVHPTGWVDPSDPENRSKILAGELMRGVGGILLNSAGQRFCNELGTRSYVTTKMLSHDPIFAKTGKWNLNATVPTFSLILSSSAAADGKKHVDLYTHKGLLTRFDGIDELAKWMKLPREVVVRSMVEYQKDAKSGRDKFGKETFKGVPVQDLDNEVFYAGTVTPVLHYCMGGIAIDKEGNVLNSDGEIIPGLHAAGEVSGGVHGVNRLGGNSLLECTVFGTIVGQKLPIQSITSSSQTSTTRSTAPDTNVDPVARKKSKIITTTELQKHNTPEDCWIAIHGIVYDLTDFAEEHPAGALSIHELAGLDGTDAFTAVHNKDMLDDFDEEIMGIYDPLSS